MHDVLILLVTVIAILSVTLIAGVFFIFSVTIMRALGRIPTASAVSAMQQINHVIVRSLFLTAFFGAALCALILCIYAVTNWKTAPAPWLLAGSIAYLAGGILLTMMRNAPLNNELDRTDAAGPEAEAVWVRYLSEWTMWNHIRTVACIISAVCFVMALLHWP